MNQLSLDLQPEPEYRNLDRRAPRGGISYRAGSKRWHVRVTINGDRRHVGFFASREQAEEALDRVTAENAPLPDPAVEEAIRIAERDPNVRCIRLTQRQFTVVDAADYGRLSRWTWQAQWSNHTRSFYAMRSKNEGHGKWKRICMNREVLGVSDGAVEVDHEDHDTLNNRRSNLRPATPGQSSYNRDVRSDSVSGIKGVREREPGKWEARISAGGVNRHLGTFTSAEAAATARNQAAIELHGEFARW